MSGGILALPIEALRVLVPVYVVAAVLMLALLLPIPGVRAHLRIWWPDRRSLPPGSARSSVP